MTFVLGALVSRLGFGASARRDSWSYLIALVAFGLAVSSMGRPSVVLLGLFVVPTFLFGMRSRGQGSAWTFAMLAGSDVSLALGISQRHADLDLWSLPGAGGWKAGAVLIGMAALLRLAAPLPQACPLFLVGWWQGLFLVWWSSTSADVLVGLAGLVLITSALVVPAGGRGLLIAGGLAAVLGGAGWTGALFPIGVAGAAFVLGERTVSTILLGALPFSAVWAEAPSQLPWGILPSLAIPLVFVAGMQGLTSAGVAGWGGRVPAVAGVIATAGLFGSDGSLTLWAAYGLGLTAAVTIFLTRPHPSVPSEKPQPEPQDWARPGLRLVAWLLLGGASLLWLRLVVIGVGTRFL